MNKIFLDPESWALLKKWEIEHAGLIKASWDRAYFPDMEIRYTHSGVVAYAEKKKDAWTIRVKTDGQSKFKVRIEKPEEYEHDFRLEYSPIDPGRTKDYIGTKEDIEQTVSFIATSVLNINAFLTYGNAYEERPVVLIGKNEGQKKVIVFRAFEGKNYAVSTSAHRSPEGIFSVRGHFRRYKNGHVIWIDEYLKGIKK